jgi:dihydropyrimidine dehydrogenase (NAD+) subunit PreT
VVGAGPAGLACAHRLAMHGHSVTLIDARPKGGGLNEYGIAAYKTPDGFAQAELDWLLAIGGIETRYGLRLGRDLTLKELREDFDAVFLGIGLGAANAIDAKGSKKDGVRAAIDFIADLRQTKDLRALPIGRRVVVIGGGMTAIDAAVQARLLGAEEVAIVYRRGRDRMGASRHEQERALEAGVRLHFDAVPVKVKGNGAVRAVEFARVASGAKGLVETGETFTLESDQVLVAIGQALEAAPEKLKLEGGKIAVDGPGRTSLKGVWAGGDCAFGGADLTVTAVAEGRDAAEDIHAALTAGG